MTVVTARKIDLAHPRELFIGGVWRAPASSATLKLVSPVSEEIFYEVAEATEADADAAVAAARAAFDDGSWPRMPPAQRAAHMRALAQALLRRADALDDAWMAQIGAPVSSARGASAFAIGLLDYYAAMAETYAFEQVRPSSGYQSKVAVVVREPVGVVLAIAPWNGPLMTLMMKLAPALAAGCTIVAKPSPETPIEAFLLAEAVEEAGLPPGVINILPADRAVSGYAVRNPGIDKVAFTGSTSAGQAIAAACAGRMARFTMELGGKSAAIILDDYDPALLGAAIAPLITGNCGQACINYSRILVPRHRHSAYVESVAAAMAATIVGDPLDTDTEMGPMAMERQRNLVLQGIAMGQSEGGRLATGGGRPARMNRGWFIEPSVLYDVTNDMRIAKEEVFGPVTAIIAYDDEEQAIAMANDSAYGLSGGVYTSDTDHAYAIARRIRTGNFTQNGREFDLTNPFGGFKGSGTGREGGIEGLEAYLEVKSVFLPKLPHHLAGSCAS